MGQRLRIGIVTPAVRASNNGNWQTAWRWSRLLGGAFEVSILNEWHGEPLDLLIALHARRSAGSVAAWHAARSGPLVVVLTGTDLYGELDTDAAARASLRLADRLVVLQDRGPDRLPAEVRGRAVVCFQSCAARRPAAKTADRLRAVMVGHLRAEKSPGTMFEVARRLRCRPDIRLDHIGAALDPVLGEQARALAASGVAYRWLGALGHGETRRRIQQAHLLVHPSRIEGGAHVIAEAVRSGTPVLASRVDGNVGMLGAEYDGYFEWNDAGALASLLVRVRDDPALLPHLADQCGSRAALFEPARERATLLALLNDLLEPPDSIRRPIF